MAIHRRGAETEFLAIREPRTGSDARIGCHEQGPEATRIPIRGWDDLLRLHAGCRNGQRPYNRLLQVPGTG